MKDIKSIFLLRGLPGSGKSTLAMSLSENGLYPVFAVDDFFTNPDNGAYHFEFDKNHLAYKACLLKVEEAMKNNKIKIFVANTFTMEWEMEPYFKRASIFKYRVFVLTVENRHGSANIHQIPREQLLKMAEKYKVVLY